MTATTRVSEYVILRATEGSDPERPAWFVVASDVKAPSREAALKAYLEALPADATDAAGTYSVVLASNWIPKPVKPKTGFEIG